jgi:methyl-accepting chemotaxis protein
MKFSIGAKLLTIFGVAIFSLIIICGLAYRETIEMVSTSEWVSHTHEVLGTLKDIMSTVKDAETGQRGYLITGEDSYLEPYNEALKVIDAFIAQLKQLVVDNPRQVQRADALGELTAKKLEELKGTVNLRRTDSFEAAKKVVLTNLGKETMDQIRKTIATMQDEEQQLLAKRDAENKIRAETTKSTIIFGILLCLLIFVISFFVINQHISQPLKQIASLSEQIANGDLSVNVPNSERSDEIGTLLKEFNKMVNYFKGMARDITQIAERNLTVKIKLGSDKDVIGHSLIAMVESLRTITQDLKDGANVLSGSTNEIQAVVSQVLAGASETSAAVNETTSTVEEVKQTAMVSSQRAKGVSEYAKLAADISQSGKKAVDASIEGMSQIKKRMESISDNIMRLSEQGQRIGEIISAVNDLAEQSNLLAVNASIEAARAGEQGRGFMIVAQEVKILADQSKQATSQVRAILTEIQKATGAAVLAAEQGSKAVETGITQVDESGKSIQALNDRVVQAAQAALQIVASSEQQVAGVSQVATAMDNIKQASSQNVVSTKQVENEAQKLNKVGQRLRELVSQFTV